ncbi:MAG: hypothetical protein ABGY42_15355 [bacterium]
MSASFSARLNNRATSARFAALVVGSLAFLAVLASAPPSTAAGQANATQAETGLEDTLREQASALSGRIGGPRRCSRLDQCECRTWGSGGSAGLGGASRA